jgi:hypothetical protein
MTELEQAREAAWNDVHGIYNSDRFSCDAGFDAGLKAAQPQWVRCKDAMPKERGWYWVTTTKSGKPSVIEAEFNGQEFLERCVTAWMPYNIPDPCTDDNTPTSDK